MAAIKLARPRFITFDGFDTLYTPLGSVARQYAKVAGDNGVSVEPDHIEANFKPAFKAVNSKYPNYGLEHGLSIESWWKQIIEQTFHPVKVTPKAVSAVYHHFNTAAAYHVYPDAQECLQALYHKGIPLGILSNGDPRMRPVLEDMGYMHYFDSSNIFISYETGWVKPSIEAFRNVQRKIDEESADRLWHVGDDRMLDVEGAKKAGWNSILIDRSQGATNDFSALEGTAPYHIRVNDMSLIPSLFE
ncbi:hypothetical protein TRVA0_009S03224 [Trichomonascus vanleenenianus]|uniref:Dpi35p n=1 Tax=Trichomonascus vanleenenianus TaxID=2268995 RepID=UPI003ECA44B6